MSTEDAFLKRLIGRWSGTCRTWFTPDKLEDESMVEGEFFEVLGGRFVRHVYTGSMKGKPRAGEELIARNSVTAEFQISWIDDFHMSGAIMFSVGPALENGFDVFGNYDIGEGHPPWGWRTKFELENDDLLRITAYNVKPGDTETKAVEIEYRRLG